MLTARFGAVGSAALLLLAGAGGIARSAGEDPFVRCSHPQESVPLSERPMVTFLREQVEAYAEAERLFAAADFLEAAFEYESVPHMHEAHDFGFLAEVVEHRMMALLEVILAAPDLEYAVRYRYLDGSTRYILVPKRPVDDATVDDVILVDKDGSRRSWVIEGRREGRWKSPAGWKVDTSSPPKSLRPWWELERSFRDYSSLAVIFNVQHHDRLVETVVRANRVKERWLASQGRTAEEILAAYRDGARRAPMVAEARTGYPWPSLDLIMLADYCVRHPASRPELLAVLCESLVPRDGPAKIGLSRIVTLNRWVPAHVTPQEIVTGLERPLEGEKEERTQQAIHILVAELRRHQAAVSYWRALRGPEPSAEARGLILGQYVNGDGSLEVQGSVSEELEGLDASGIARARLEGLLRGGLEGYDLGKRPAEADAVDEGDGSGPPARRPAQARAVGGGSAEGGGAVAGEREGRISEGRGSLGVAGLLLGLGVGVVLGASGAWIVLRKRGPGSAGTEVPTAPGP